MTRKAVYRLPLPPSVNECWRNVPRRGRVATGKYKAWKAEAAWKIRAACPEIADGWVQIEILASLRRVTADLDNVIKPVLDALQEGQALVNDRTVRRLTVERAADSSDGWVVVWVSAAD